VATLRNGEPNGAYERLRRVRRKLVPTPYERLVHAGGSGADVRVFDAAVGTVGCLLCGEHLNHVLAFALLAQGQASHAASWPRYVGDDREALERRPDAVSRRGGESTDRARDGTVTDDLAAAIGDPTLSEGPSLSAVVSPSGEYPAGPRFDVFDLHVDRDPREPVSFDGPAPE
jgi:nitrilase